MVRASVLLCLCACALAELPPVAPLDNVFFDLKICGLEAPFMSGLTSRHVGGQLRFLTYWFTQKKILEFTLPAVNGTLTAANRSWNVASTPGFSDMNGLWFEESKNRLWVTSTVDYTTIFASAHITLLTLGDDVSGTVTVIGTWYLGLPEKRFYGGCQPSPLAAHKYICGWGGYTSLVMQSGSASMGPTMYGIDDPTNVAAGSNLTYTTILDAFAGGSRGVRLSTPINYFDGGDNRPNPQTPPSVPPIAGASWLSPEANGTNWFVWGDSYYNTGITLPGGFLAVASLCKGKCWYMHSTLNYDARQFELHWWPTSTLGSNLLARPSMVPLDIPILSASPGGLSGDGPAGNVGGATFVDGNFYFLACQVSEVYACRVFRAASGTPASPTAQSPTAQSPTAESPTASTGYTESVLLACVVSIVLL